MSDGGNGYGRVFVLAVVLFILNYYWSFLAR
ncbi:YjcZ family sporulation protein [Heyndrickxia sporothermodurans]